MQTSTDTLIKSQEGNDSFLTYGSSRNASNASVKSITVALTGSTSNFGTYILDFLLRSPNISKIYCLNRSADARERQERAHEARGLSTCFSKDHVEFLQVEFSSENWGMNNDFLKIFISEVDVVVHNAWPVDFNRNFVSFQPHISGIRHLTEMARQSQNRRPPATPSNRPMRILFVSSIGIVSNWASQAPTSRSFVPEAELTDWKLARTGYGQSKLLSERILAHAARCFRIPVTIARVGQMAGPVLQGEKGSWPEKEWLPSLIKSSIYLGVVPESLGPLSRIDWIPVDVAAHVLMDLLMQQQNSSDGLEEGKGRKKKKSHEAQFYHIINPCAVQGSDILSTIQRHLPRYTRIIPIEDWVDILEKSAEAGQTGIDQGANPAAKLMDTFEHVRDRATRFPKARAAILDTKKTVRASPSLASLQAVDRQWMDLWIRQWGL